MSAVANTTVLSNFAAEAANEALARLRRAGFFSPVADLEDLLRGREG